MEGTTRPFRHPRLAWAAVLVGLLIPSSTQALTLDEVVVLTRGGIPVEDILRALRDSRAVHDLTPADAAKLRDQGVHPRVIRFVRGARLLAARATPPRLGVAGGLALGHRLLKAGLQQSAFDVFAETAVASTQVATFTSAFEQVVALRPKLAHAPPLPANALAARGVGLSGTLACSLNYLAGHEALERGNDRLARRLLGEVRRSCHDYRRARFLMGLVEVRRGFHRSAVARFQEAVGPGKGLDEVGQLAWMALAGVALEERHPEGARVYLSKIPERSRHWTTARTMLVHAHLQSAREPYALGAIETLRRLPTHQRPFLPGLASIEVAARASRCHTEAAHALARHYLELLRPTYVASRSWRNRALRHSAGPYAFIASQATRKPRLKASERLFLRRILRDPAFGDLHRARKQALTEIAGLQKRFPGATGVALRHRARARLDFYRLLLDRRVLDLLNALLSELTTTLAELDDLYAETVPHYGCTLKNPRSRPEETSPSVFGKRGGSPALAGQDTIQWPFEGERWPGEASRLVVAIPDKCPPAD